MIPRRGITIVVGYRGATKTTWACWLAARVTDDGGIVFYASQEDDVPSFIRPRMEAAGANLDQVFFPDKDDSPLVFPHGLGRLAEYVERKQPSLVLLDPLSAFVPEYTSAKAARESLGKLARISREHDCAMVLIHHFRKSGGKSVSEAMGGAGALSDVARAVYMYGLEPQPDPIERLLGIVPVKRFFNDEGEDGDEERLRILACEKVSAAATPLSLLFRFHTADTRAVEQVPRVTLVGESNDTAERLLAGQMTPSGRGEDATAVEQAITFLLNLLKDGEVAATKIQEDATLAGVAWRTVQRAKSKAGIPSYRRDGQWFWRLPEMPDAPPENWAT
jgi:putative DNA primase/helicase